MPDYLKEARKAEKEKIFSRAGEFYRLAGEIDSAVEMYMKAEDYILAAGLMEQKGNWSAAANLYERGRQYRDAAKIYEKIKDYRSAFSMYEKINDYPRASEMAEKAEDYFKAAVMAEEAKTLERAAKLYIQANQYPQAARIHYKLLQQLVDSTEKRFFPNYEAQLAKHANTTAMLYERINDHAKAAYCYQLARNHKKAAESYLADQKPEKAAEIYHQLKSYNKAFEILSGLTDVSNKPLFAEVCYQLKKFDKAATLFQQCGNLGRAADACEQAKLYNIAAKIYEELGNFKRAAEMCLKANNKIRAAELYEKTGNFGNSAILYQQSGQNEKALESYLAIGRRIPAAKIALQIKDEDRAIFLLQAINPMEEEYKDACALLGVIFAERGMSSAAQRKFEEALERPTLTKTNLDIYFDLAMQQEKMGMRAEAADLYERILSVDFSHKEASRRLEELRRSAVYHIPDTFYVPQPSESVENIQTSGQPRIVASRYELVEEMIHDASGKVYKASDQFFQRPVMIRILPKQDQNLTQVILKCTQLSSALNHSNILAIYDGGKDKDDYFVCTEYVDGQTLRQYLSDHSLNIQEVVQIAQQIILALAYVHKKGLIHGNLTPENIYVAADKSVKVTNFGNLAVWEKQNAAVVKQYLSPEQLTDLASDERSDVYSFGIILYELAYGNPPFSGVDVEQQHLSALPVFEETPLHTVPDFLIRIMKKSLSKDRNRRYANADEIQNEFETPGITPGVVINGRYEIVRELGEGGMGNVYQARDRDLDEIVALKMLKGEIGGDPDMLQRFIREIKVARMIAHPNVVRVFDTGTYEANRYITMEYIDGISFDRWIDQSREIDLKTRLNILLKIIQGVQAAHARGIVHRDLKPQNILIDSDLIPHILDFGISRVRTHKDSSTTAKIVLGSPKYTSPEQISGQEADYRSDIYSLGVLTFYMLTFQEPFSGDDVQSILMKHLTLEPASPRHLNPEIPLWLEDIVLRALRKDPAKRFENLDEMLADLKFGIDFKQNS